MNCDPAELVKAAKCFQCIPKGKLPEVQILLACVASGGVVPSGFLKQSENDDYIVLDDGGRIILS